MEEALPRPAKGPRLYLYEHAGRATTWIIRDGSKRIATGYPASARGEAEKALALYITRKHEPVADGRSTKIMDILIFYSNEHNSDEPVPTHLKALAPFWAAKTLADVNARTCRAYVAHRQSLNPPRSGRREMETLNAAIRYCAREHGTPIVLLTLPEKGLPRDRWLTRAEAARLVAGALGWAYAPRSNVQTRRVTAFVKVGRPAYYIARMILLGLYTGTRHGALLKLNWNKNIVGGWVDLERGVIYRKSENVRETKKRQPPLRIPVRLLPHLRRWRRLDGGVGPVVSYGGDPIKKERRAWATARRNAGLGDEVVIHTLRHTCATWLMQNGVDMWEAAGFLGMTYKMMDEVYGHHSPHFQSSAAAAFGGAKK